MKSDKGILSSILRYTMHTHQNQIKVWSWSHVCFCLQLAVLHLTCNDDHVKLKEVLDWAKSQSLKPVEIDSETTSDYVGRNPILLSVLQGHRKCTALLHGFGYSIQEKRRKAFCNSKCNTASNSCDFSWNPFKMAKSYFDNQICRYSEENQVQNLLDFKGYAENFQIFGKL